MKTKSIVSIFIVMVYLVTPVVSAAGSINTLEKGLFGYSPSGVAIRGYDTVAYHILNEAMKGQEGISVKWAGATWYFDNEQHRDLFVARPEVYAPAFGGYCAYGVAMGSLLKVEGDQWAIVDGKLYLNFDRKWLDEWKKDADKLILMAEANYPGLVGGGD